MPIIATLIGWGVPAKLAKPLIALAALLLFAGTLWLSLHLYGQHRYNEGAAAEDAKWQVAVDQLKKDAAKSATKADDAAATRTAVFIQQHTKDQEAVNAAEQKGTSPLDALFGN